MRILIALTLVASLFACKKSCEDAKEDEVEAWEEFGKAANLDPSGVIGGTSDGAMDKETHTIMTANLDQLESLSGKTPFVKTQRKAAEASKTASIACGNWK